MSCLLKAFFYKISKDITFRITLIIGGGVAILSVLLFFLLDQLIDLEGVKLLTGHGMLVTAFSPAQNYGIAIPINVVSFIVLEFTQGTIRNKIIAGHSKFKIYASLYISGLILAASLLFIYVGTLTLFGTIFGGFDVNVATMLGSSGIGAYATTEYIIKFVIHALLAYTTIVSYAVFIATAFRSMGPSIPLVFVAIFGLYFIGMIYGSMVVGVERAAWQSYSNAIEELAKEPGNELAIAAIEQEMAEMKPTYDTMLTVENILKCVDPLYSVSYTETYMVGVGDNMKTFATMDNLGFYGGIASNLAYSAAFFFGGACLFKKRDVK